MLAVLNAMLAFSDPDDVGGFYISGHEPRIMFGDDLDGAGQPTVQLVIHHKNKTMYTSNTRHNGNNNDYGAVLVGDGQYAYAIGGGLWQERASGTGYCSYCCCDSHYWGSNHVERYYPQNNTWQRISPMIKHRREHGGTYHQGFIYVCGGRCHYCHGYGSWVYHRHKDSRSLACEKYDIANDEWTPMGTPGLLHTDFRSNAGYDNLAYSMAAFNDKIWLMQTDRYMNSGSRGWFNVYDPRLDTWERLGGRNNNEPSAWEVWNDEFFMFGINLNATSGDISYSAGRRLEDEDGRSEPTLDSTMATLSGGFSRQLDELKAQSASMRSQIMQLGKMHRDLVEMEMLTQTHLRSISEDLR